MLLGLGMAVGLGMCLWLLRGADEEHLAVQIRQTMAGYNDRRVKFANVCCLMACVAFVPGVKQIILGGMQNMPSATARFSCELCTLTGTALRASS